jgi:hypothetical protein
MGKMWFSIKLEYLNRDCTGTTISYLSLLRLTIKDMSEKSQKNFMYFTEM